ncbi:MAG: hypothetical protein COA99_10950 [Moraxellaceae bacterium]|nr:MAG: hypothetical protein COA99_10950 [Moraxellaceae bacterium]
MNSNKIAVIQMVSTDDVARNLLVAENLIASAAEQGAKLVLLPENFAVFSAKKMRDWAEKEEREQVFTAFLSRMARAHSVWLVGGTVPLLPGVLPGVQQQENSGTNSSRKVTTSTLVYDDKGQLKAQYDKIHLFDVQVNDGHGQYCESEHIDAGVAPVVVDTPLGVVGLSVCYDLRFPELYSTLVAMGAEIIMVPSAFTWETGKAHWEILLRARAIENQCYIVGANQGGVHTENRRTWGHSTIVDPWGKVLGVLAEGEADLVREIDLGYLRELRQNMPLQQHKYFSIVVKNDGVNDTVEAVNVGGIIGE